MIHLNVNDKIQTVKAENFIASSIVHTTNLIQLKFSVLDSSGEPNSGFLLGNNFWLGSPNVCKHVNEELKLTLSDRFERTMKKDLLTSLSPFEVQFRVVHAKHNSPWQVQMKVLSENVLHIGLCLPKSCSNGEVHNLVKRYFDEQKTKENLFEIDLEILQVKDLEIDRSFFFQKLSVWIFW
jgi:hypothetical protein